MALTDARARAPGLITLPAQPEADRKTLQTLAHWCTQYTPWVNVDGTDGLFLDITGCGHLFGSEIALAENLVNRLKTLGYTARAGLSQTPGAAWGLARYSTIPLAQLKTPKDRENALKQLPIEALRLTPATLTLLNRLGLKQIGALCDIPRTALTRRFSSSREGEAVRNRLDQALGLLSEPISPITPPAFHRTRLNLPEPITTLEAIDECLKRLLSGLCQTLETDQLGARALSFVLYHTDGIAKAIKIASSRPSRNAEHFYNLFREHLDGIDPGFGIDILILNADRTEPLTATQTALEQGTSHKSPEENNAQLIDRLSNRFGPKNVYCLCPEESYIPERAQSKKAALTAFTQKTKASWLEEPSPQNSGNKQTKAKLQPSQGRKNPPDRPTRLLQHPEPIQVIAEVPDGPPLSFNWRRITRRVAFATGPERIAPEWWHDPALTSKAQPPEKVQPYGHALCTRDYYKIEDDLGHIYWVYRAGLYEEERQDLKNQGAPTWYLHGIFT